MSKVGVGKIKFGIFIEGKPHIIYEHDLSNVRSRNDPRKL